jgi:uncharacterized protein YdcH (DUF465 family)
MDITSTETIEQRQAAADLFWAKVQEARAKNPQFKKVIELHNERASLHTRIRMLEQSVETVTREIEEAKTKLSLEERELL